jgi:thiamine pyrophosphate-dependent acetolactate synthase large subunit-like protein
MTDAQDLAGVERPQNVEGAKLEWGSDLVAEMLRRLKIEFVALNPGASYRGLHDSLVNYLGNRMPQMLMVLHEEHAVAIAHGYAKVSGKPMAALLHSNVGLMHGSMAIYDAWCDRVPVLVLGANGPLDAAKRRPWIDWIHTTCDQGAPIRNFVKWDDTPLSPEAAADTLLRAYQIALRAPQGPVYVCIPVELQELKLSSVPVLPETSRYGCGAILPPASQSLAEAARILLEAKHPVILMGRVSRRREAWNNRIRLAEMLGATVVTDLRAGAAFPTSHPLHARPAGLVMAEEAVAALRAADALLSLDWIDLGGTLKLAYGSASRAPGLIQVSLDAYNHRAWSADYMALAPADLSILNEPDLAVEPLLEAIRHISGKEYHDSDWINLPGGRALARKAAAKQEPSSQSSALSMTDIARALGAVAGERQISLLRLPIGWPADACDFTGPLDYLGYDGGGGVGSGPGMAVGGALALGDSAHLPVAILGDGDYLMGVSALWTAAKYRIAVLLIVANNQSFYNDEMHQEKVARQRGREPQNKWIGQKIIEPTVDLAALARAQGLQGLGPVSSPGELREALEKAIAYVEAGAGCVVDVVIKPGYEGSSS